MEFFLLPVLQNVFFQLYNGKSSVFNGMPVYRIVYTIYRRKPYSKPTKAPKHVQTTAHEKNLRRQIKLNKNKNKKLLKNGFA